MITRSLLCVVACTATLQLARATLYDASSDVVTLTPENFDKRLGKGVWLVEFFAPWCGHCKSLKPEWDKAATALKGIVGVAAVDAEAHAELGKRYDVQGFPTIKLIIADGKGGKLQTLDYQGGRTAKDIVLWATQQAQKIALRRLGVTSGGSSGNGGGGGGGGGNAGGGGGGFYGGTRVTPLDDSNFHSQVVDSDDMWFVEFYAPWCGHCKSLKPTWIELAGALEGSVRVGAVDCTESQATCTEFGVKGFPTLKLFGKDKGRPDSYDGARDLASLTSFATERWARARPPPEVRELAEQETWEEQCLGQEGNEELGLAAVKPKQLCLVAFLPHILDAGAAGRTAHLGMLAKVAAVYKDRPFSWFWAEGGAQPGLEANLGVGGYGYPALVALNPAKAKYATLRGAFQEGSVKEFMDSVRTGRERVADVAGPAARVEPRAPWDGEDARVEEEEEFSLEDLGIGSGREESGQASAADEL